MPPKPLAEDLARKKAAKNKGSGWGWAGNLVGDLVDMAKNPLDTAKTLGSMAKDTFIDPVLELPEAFRPGSGLSPAGRVATGLGGGLAIADAATPFIPEGAFANSAQRALARRMADASNSGRQYRAPVDTPVIPDQSPTYTDRLRGLSDAEYGQAILMRRGTPIADIKGASAANEQALADIVDSFRNRLYSEVAQRAVRKRRGWPDMGPDGEAIFP